MNTHRHAGTQAHTCAHARVLLRSGPCECMHTLHCVPRTHSHTHTHTHTCRYPPSHQWFAQWEAKGDFTIRYFLEPVVLSINHAVKLG